MTQDVRQWLTEIKQLKQQLAETLRDRDAAQASAEQWRQLYNTEAQQRREEAKRHQEAATALKVEMNRLQAEFLGPKHELATRAASHREVGQLKTPEEFKAKLLETILERDHLREQMRQLNESLDQEKANHLQTRNSLTTALGDTVDLLTRANQEKANPGENILALPMEEIAQTPDPVPRAEKPQGGLAKLLETSQLPLPKLLPTQEDE
ncbi:MAG: hypothetical protein HC835_19275 [Oscillatoriales cyanobacterium RM2_1_1]|nr:hypothetical protein [Oscillatoriales cyanobacterium SM2_3_0]NJO47566.1 hypothetical protein [Oscillatoriales cyanobacterium RM2_1_1]